MFALDDADVVDKLIEVLNRELRCIRIRSDVQAIAEIMKSDVRKCIQSGVLKVPRRYVLVKAIVADAELIGYAGRECVIFARIHQCECD